MANTKCKIYYDLISYDGIKFFWVWNEKGVLLKTTFFENNIGNEWIRSEKREFKKIFYNYFHKKIPIPYSRINFMDHSKNEFEKRVYETVTRIPFGSVLSYKEVSKLAGKPNSQRIVGRIMAKNKLPIVIPCHRVIMSNGKIGGFSGGIHIKKFLLKHEGIDFKE